MPGTRLEEYEIEIVHHQGSDSVLYRAHDHRLQRPVALREYFPVGLARREADLTVLPCGPEEEEVFGFGLRAFTHEARLLGHCEHPALLKVLHFWEANGTAYMAMPWHEGQTLQQSRRLSDPPDESWLRALLLDLLGAVQELHAMFSQHREITPKRILLQPDERPVLLGFHAARSVLVTQGRLIPDPSGQAYLPLEAHPEGLHLHQGPWSDLYSLAAVAYFCLTGAPPPSARERVLKRLPGPLSGAARAMCIKHPGLNYSSEFLAALDWAFELQPQHRPQSVSEWGAVLKQQHSAAPIRPAFNRKESRWAPGRSADLAGGLVAPLPSVPSACRQEDVPVPSPVSRAAGRGSDAAADRGSGAPSREKLLSGSPGADSSFQLRKEPTLNDAVAPLETPQFAAHRELTSAQPALPKPSPARRSSWALAGMLLVAVAAMGGLWLQQDRQDLVRSSVDTAPPTSGSAGAASVSSAQRPADEVRSSPEAVSSVQEPAIEPAVPPQRVAPPPLRQVGSDASRPEASSRVNEGAPQPHSGSVVQKNLRSGGHPSEAGAHGRDDRNRTSTQQAAERGGRSSTGNQATPVLSPRAVCAPRERFSLYYCMQQQCKKAQFYTHRQCVTLRERDEIE